MTEGFERTPLSWAAFFAASGIWGSTFLVISIGNDALDPCGPRPSGWDWRRPSWRWPSWSGRVAPGARRSERPPSTPRG